ncbi:MAG: TrmB family transcriptional regulator [Haloarculaceae archaeon]
MPIDIETFERTPEQELWADRKGVIGTDAVLAFLSERPDQAFTATEIREGADLPRGCIGIALARLEDAGRVRHRGAYWTVTGAATD